MNGEKFSSIEFRCNVESDRFHSKSKYFNVNVIARIREIG